MIRRQNSISVSIEFLYKAGMRLKVKPQGKTINQTIPFHARFQFHLSFSEVCLPLVVFELLWRKQTERENENWAGWNPNPTNFHFISISCIWYCYNNTSEIIKAKKRVPRENFGISFHSLPPLNSHAAPIKVGFLSVAALSWKYLI